MANRSNRRLETLAIAKCREHDRAIRNRRANTPSWPGQLSPPQRPDIREQSILKTKKAECLQNGRSPYTHSKRSAVRRMIWIRALTRGDLSGSSSRGRDTFFCFAKRKYPKKRRPDVRALRLQLRVPCASRLKRRLRNSRWPCRPSLKQSSPTSPFQPAMLGALDGSPFVVAQTIEACKTSFFRWAGSRSGIGLQARLQSNTRVLCRPASSPALPLRPKPPAERGEMSFSRHPLVTCHC